MCDQTTDGATVRFLTVIDEFTREGLWIECAWTLTSVDVVRVLEHLVELHGVPAVIRSDNGPEFVAKKVQDWLKDRGIGALFIEPGSPWEHGYSESFNGKLRDELLDGEIFHTLMEAKVLIERWREHYNRFRPHSSLGYRPPAPEAVEIGMSGMDILMPGVALGLT